MVDKNGVLKDDNNDIYPITYDFNVYNSNNESLDTVLSNMQSSIQNKADINANNLSSANVISWKQKLNIGLIYSKALSASTASFTINKNLEDGVYKLCLIGVSSAGLDLSLKFNGVDKTTYGNMWSSYGSNAPVGSSSNLTNFPLGLAGDNFTITNAIITINSGVVSVEVNNIGKSTTVYRRNGLYYADGYSSITSLQLNTSAGTINQGFKIYLYKIS